MTNSESPFAPARSPQRGTLFLVIGPSGAGKKTLIDGASAAHVGNEHYIFPRRYVTDPINAADKDHIPLSSDLFSQMLERGDMVLEWRTHNVRYGVPKAVAQHLERGRNVVVSVSRTVVDEARRRFSPVKILYISVDDETLARRLQQRDRESAAEIKRRVGLAREYLITGDDVVLIDNGSDLETSVDSFVAAIAVVATD